MEVLSYDQLSSPFVLLALAIMIDMIFGEPQFLWSRITHPIVLFGRSISWLERRFNTRSVAGRTRRLFGVVAILIWVAIAISAGLLANSAIALLPAPLNFLIECIIIAILLAGKSLYEHIEAVREPLAEGDIEGARFAVSMIVGRDTSRLDSSDIGRAAIETGAENLSDGILAPAIWYLLGGLPLLFAYKMINTADSMVGYKSARYYAFGWGSAILDDIVNFFPARITALLIMITAFLRGTAGQAFRAMKNDASKHASPNAGYPESAMAGALGLRLGGARWYRGHLLSLPEMNHQGRDAILPDDIENALSMLWHTLGLTAIASLMIGFWF